MFFRTSTTLRIPAQARSPLVPNMKPHTISWSFSRSRWKHCVTTSFSSASLQFGSDCSRQNFLVHCSLQTTIPAAREKRCVAGVSAMELCCAPAAGSSFGGGGGSVFCAGGCSCEDLSSMMMLFVKQVHLQNVGASARLVSVGIRRAIARRRSHWLLPRVRPALRRGVPKVLFESWRCRCLCHLAQWMKSHVEGCSSVSLGVGAHR
jgi:hypothetical protein